MGSFIRKIQTGRRQTQAVRDLTQTTKGQDPRHLDLSDVDLEKVVKIIRRSTTVPEINKKPRQKIKNNTKR